MLIKTRLNNGGWKLFSGTNVVYMDRRSPIELPNDIKHEEVTSGAFDDVLPTTWDEVHMESPLTLGNYEMVFAKWVVWDDDNATHLLITSGPTYICNDQGQTLEALH